MNDCTLKKLFLVGCIFLIYSIDNESCAWLKLDFTKKSLTGIQILSVGFNCSICCSYDLLL